jgi:hypothetical protein
MRDIVGRFHHLLLTPIGNTLWKTWRESTSTIIIMKDLNHRHMITESDGMFPHLILVLFIMTMICLLLMGVIHVNHLEYQIMGGDFLPGQ